MNPDPDPNPPPPETTVQPGKPGFVVGLSAEDLVTLNDEIAGMARAGLPLDQGLAALAKEMGRGRLQRVTAAIAADLQAGYTLPQALERQAGRVPPFYAGLVTAGVRTGRLGEVLATLTLYARTMADLRSVVLGALLYPLIVSGLAVLLFWLVFAAIIPQFDQIFRDFKLRVPALTEWVLEVGRHPLWYLVLPLVGTMAVFIAWRLFLGCTPEGRRFWARFVYTIPILGGLIRSARLAGFTELLGILVDHGLPLGEAFGLAGAASSDPIMADAAKQVQVDLSQGLPLGDVMRKRSLVPEVIAWMTGLGEQRGNLGTTLHRVAEMYRRQVEMRAALLRSVLPPFLLIITAALLVGLFIIAIMLPMFSLLEGLSGGAK